MSRFKSPDSDQPDESAPRQPEKTMGITPSQILEIEPRSSAPAPRRRQPELSMWAGDVLRSDEFVPEAVRIKRRVPWGLLGLVVVSAAAGLVWRSWPKVPFSKLEWPGLAKASPAPPTPPAPAAATTPVALAAPPAAAPDAAAEIPALAPPSPSVEASPTEGKVVAKKSHSTKSKHKRSKRHRKSSRSHNHSPSTGF